MGEEKKGDWLVEQAGDRNIVVMKHMGDIDMWLPGVGEDGLRAGVGANKDVPPCDKCGQRTPIPIAASPRGEDAADLKNAFLTLCRERILAEITNWNSLADHVRTKGAFEGDAAVSIQEVLDFLEDTHSVALLTKGGDVVKPSFDEEAK
jgi:hypothetical protein